MEQQTNVAVHESAKWEDNELALYGVPVFDDDEDDDWDDDEDEDEEEDEDEDDDW